MSAQISAIKATAVIGFAEKPRNSPKQFQRVGILVSMIHDLYANLLPVRLQFINMGKTLHELNRLLSTNRAVDGHPYFFDRMLAAFVDERRNIKGLTGMSKDMLNDRPKRFPEDIRENIVQFQIGDSQTILSVVFLACDHIRQLCVVAKEITELTNIRGRDIARLDHVTYEQVADPFCVFTIRLVALLRLGVLGMDEDDEDMLFKDIEHGNPVFSG